MFRKYVSCLILLCTLCLCAASAHAQEIQSDLEFSLEKFEKQMAVVAPVLVSPEELGKLDFERLPWKVTLLGESLYTKQPVRVYAEAIRDLLGDPAPDLSVQLKKFYVVLELNEYVQSKSASDIKFTPVFLGQGTLVLSNAQDLKDRIRDAECNLLRQSRGAEFFAARTLDVLRALSRVSNTGISMPARY